MERKVYILMSAGSMEWRIDGVYDTPEQVRVEIEDYLTDEEKSDLDNGKMDLDDLDWREWEMMLQVGTYYPCIATQRNDKIDTVVQ